MSAIEKILQEEIEAGKIANLSTRPTDSRTLGGDGLTPKQLREKYDELPLLAINKINEILTAIGGGSATVDDILTMIKTPIPNGEDEYKTLYEVLEDVVTGAFSMYQVVGEDTLVNIIDGLNSIVSALDSDLDSHIANKSNPHEVTKAQLGLGNVDNTSDANKPISAATQAALDLKASASQLSSALSDILSLQQKVGAQAIPFTDISDAINQLNDDVNTLQGGVVPRINRGIIQYNNPSETVTPALASALTAFIVENFSRQPNNTDKVTVEDNQGSDTGSYWSYQYWKGYDTLTDGWYWDSYAKIPAMNDIVAYYKNILIADWTISTDGLYHIGVTAADHGQGTSPTVLVDLYANVSGKFTRMNTFTPQTNGDIDIYTDERFDGYVVIRSAKSHWFVPMEENPETLQRISDLENGKYTKPSGGIPETDLTSSVQTKLNKTYYRHLVGIRGITSGDTDERIECVVEVINTRSTAYTDIDEFALDATVNGKWLLGDMAFTGIASQRTQAGSGKFVKVDYDSDNQRIGSISYLREGTTGNEIHYIVNIDWSSHSELMSSLELGYPEGTTKDFVYEL